MKKDKLKERLIQKGVSKDWLEKNFVHITDEEKSADTNVWRTRSVLPQENKKDDGQRH